MRPIRFYSVIMGERFQKQSYYSTLSIIKKNPGISYTIVFVDTNPNEDYRKLAAEGKLIILLDSLNKYNPPKSKVVYQLFWYRYAIVPGLLGGGFLCHLDTDLICVSPFPDKEIVETRINATIDGPVESNGEMLKTLSSNNWWVPVTKRSLYINAGLMAWDHSIYGWVFEEFDRLIREDSERGVFDDAPFGDQPYINSILNSSGKANEYVNLLPSKWNLGVWTHSMVGNVGDVIAVKKAVNLHVFGAAGKERVPIMKDLYSLYVDQTEKVL